MSLVVLRHAQSGTPCVNIRLGNFSYAEDRGD